MTQSNQSAYRRGLWRCQIWVLVFLFAAITVLVWLAFDGRIEYKTSLFLIGLIAAFSFLLYLYQIGRWKLWMVDHAENPKIVLELARDGFMPYHFLENLAFMGPSSRRYFHETFERRMVEIRSRHLANAANRFKEDQTLFVHQKLSPTLKLLIFELLVMIAIGILFYTQQDTTIRIITALLMIMAMIGFFYTIKWLWLKHKTLLEISRHGVRIEGNYYGWADLEVIDVIKGNTLMYKPKNGEQLEQKVNRLSMDAATLDEAILYYRTLPTTQKDNPASL